MNMNHFESRRALRAFALPIGAIMLAFAWLPLNAEAGCPIQHSVSTKAGTAYHSNKRNVSPNNWVAAYKQHNKLNGSFGQAYAFSPSPRNPCGTIEWNDCVGTWTSGGRPPETWANARLCNISCTAPVRATDNQRSCPCPCFLGPGDDNQSIAGFSSTFTVLNGSTNVEVTPESGLRIVARQPLAEGQRPVSRFTITITNPSGTVMAEGSVELAVRGGSEGNVPEIIKTGMFSDAPFVVEGAADEFFVSLGPVAQRVVIDISGLDVDIETHSAGPESSLCNADINADAAVDFFDYLDFVVAFADQSAGSDFNGDQIVDFFDYLDFVEEFAAGC